MSEPLTVGSLFSGIGGIDLGLERAGMVTRWFCEIDPHCRNVLARHWPGLPIYGDITAVDWSGVEPVDVLAGGFPCQPVSIAGDRNAQTDERWLWPEFERAIRELRPHYVVVENVRNLLAVNGGSAFAEVLAGLAALGFDAEWDCIPALTVGAPHERDRLWLVAYRAELQGAVANAHNGRSSDSLLSRWDASRDGNPDVAHSERAGLEGTARTRQPGAGRPSSIVTGRAPQVAYTSSGSDRPKEIGRETDGPSIYRSAGRVGRSDWWDSEPDVGRVAHGVPHRVDRLRSLGNAVVPQVVEWIGRRIVAFDEGRVAA